MPNIAKMNIGTRKMGGKKLDKKSGGEFWKRYQGAKDKGYSGRQAAAIAASEGRLWAVTRKLREAMFPEHIVKVGDKYELKSRKTGKHLGTYRSRAGAEKRERQVQYFKHHG